MSIQLDQTGRRIYLRGNTYPIKDQIKSLGGHWDPDSRAWWVGTGKREAVETLAAAGANGNGNGNGNGDSVDLDARVIKGRAKYNGKTYYVLWAGTKRDGSPGAKLAFRDGSKTFWAKDGVQVQVLKTYQDPKSINSLRDYADRMKRESDGGECECSCHGGQYCDCPAWCSFHHDGCDRCGCEF